MRPSNTAPTITWGAYPPQGSKEKCWCIIII